MTILKKSGNLRKWSKTLGLAFIVGLSSEVRLTAITSGFIIAMSVLMMSLFLYSFEERRPLAFILCCAVISPLIRLMNEIYIRQDFGQSLKEVIPDVCFFIAYGIVYSLLYRMVFQEKKTMRTFPIMIFFADAVGNVVELSLRSILFQNNVITFHTIGIVLCVAFFRTAIMQIIVFAIESYSNILLQHEMDEEFKRLLAQTSKLDGEMYIIDKNIAEMEDVMKQAYCLYRELEADEQVPPHFKKEALAIARLVHEIKGDYKGVAEVIRTQFMYEPDSGGMPMSDILSIEKKDAETVLKNKKIQAEIQTRIRNDFYVKPYFEMISVIRNLLMNSAEAFGEKGGKIKITVSKDENGYVIEESDNGPGMSEECLQSIFLDGFSTKFDDKTGNIQRGLGLPLVKDYVEKKFKGTIQAESKEGSYTRFLIRIPTETVAQWERGGSDEVLHC